MHARAAAVIVRSLVAIAAAVGVVAQLTVTIRRHDGLVNFFSYFTYEVAIFAAVVFALGALQAAGILTLPRAFSAVRGAAATYLAFVGLVFNFLLASGGTGDLLPWVNVILHQTLPVVAVVEWIVWPPGRRLPLWISPVWLVYPLVYVPYSLIRGAIIDFYEYPFFDPHLQHGYGGVAIYCGALIGAFLILGFVIRAIGNVLGRRYGDMSTRGGVVA